MGRRIPFISVEELEITDLAFGGSGIARHDNIVFMVNGGIPGQKVKIRIVKRSRKFVECKIVEILRRSPLESKIEYQDVPGAIWGRLSLDTQREYKLTQIKDLFMKMAQLDIEPIFEEYIDSPQPFGYRNKMEYSFGHTEKEWTERSEDAVFTGFGLGSKFRGSYYLVENLERSSVLFDHEFEQKLSLIRDYCRNTELPPYNPFTHRGFFKYLNVRKSFHQNTFLINLITSGDFVSSFHVDDFLAFLQEQFQERLAGFCWKIHDIQSDAKLDEAVEHFNWGDQKIDEKVGDLIFEVSSNSFFQTNSKSCEKLHDKIVEYVGDCEGHLLLDMFCGVGCIAQVLAKHFPQNEVIGVEISEQAINDAKSNALRNNLQNIEFHCADVRVFTRNFKKTDQKPMTIVVDPPRSGVDPKPLKRIAAFRPDRLIYVSCNPSTLARDTSILKGYGYELLKISAVDQFTHTHHIECVALFEPCPSTLFPTELPTHQ